MMKRTLSIILAALILLVAVPMSVSAAEHVTRTQGLDLRKAEYETDQANESEGWSWDFDTKTLTLDNCRIEVGEDNAITFPTGSVNLVLVGENYLSAYGNEDWGNKVISQKGSCALKICGEGSLTVEAMGPDDAISVTTMTIESGDVKVLNGMVWALNGVTVNGGRLEIDVTNAADDGSGIGDDCIYSDGKVEITGGEVILKAQRAGIFIDGWVQPTPPNGLVITGGDVYLEGGTCAAWIGYDGEKKVIIDTTGSLTIGNSTLGIYSGNGTIEVLKGTINNPGNLERDMLFRDPDNEVKYAPADYSAVDAALAKVPADLTKYTEESAAAVQAAIDAVDKELDVLDQAKVDEYAKAIETALEGLEEDGFFNNVKKFFENLFNGECAVLNWLKRVIDIIVAFFTGLFNGLVG